jgi:hypothetical protein
VHIKLQKRPTGVRMRASAALAVASCAALIGIAGLAFNAWYDHRSSQYEADSANPYLGYRAAAGGAFGVGLVLLLGSAVLAAIIALLPSTSSRARSAGVLVTVVSLATVVARYRYQP